MIYDTIENIKKYKGMSKNLDTAIDFIIKTDLTKLPLGQTKVDSDRVFVNVMDANAQDRDNLNFEIHSRYIDIQLDLEGKEIVDIGCGTIEEIQPIDELKDIGFYQSDNYSSCILGPGRFIVCMNGEPHKPGVRTSEQTVLRKCVVKVAV